MTIVCKITASFLGDNIAYDIENLDENDHRIPHFFTLNAHKIDDSNETTALKISEFTIYPRLFRQKL